MIIDYNTDHISHKNPENAIFLKIPTPTQLYPLIFRNNFNRCKQRTRSVTGNKILKIIHNTNTDSP